MAHYIDADRLRAEINRRIKIHKELSEKPEMSDLRLELQMVDDNLQSIISFIDSLQQEMWKPSEEQMKALKLAYEDAFECPEGGVPHLVLHSLLFDLQKLL